MALSKAAIAGDYLDATEAAGLTEVKAVYTLSGIDTESTTVLLPTEIIAELTEACALPAQFKLWKNTAGLRGTFYRHLLRGKREARPGFWELVDVPLPSFQVGPSASYTLTALLNNPVPDAPGWNVNLDPEAWAELQAQFEAAEAARVAAEEARDALLAVCVPVSQFGLMGDGSYEDDALEAALASDVSGIEFEPNKTYRFNRKITLRGKSAKVIKLNGAKLLRGPDGRGGVHWITSSGIRTLGGGGQLVGNRDTAGPWRSHFTTTGITSGSRTGTAGASYTTGHPGPIKIEGLGVGYVKKGDSFTYVRLGETYRHIVQADVGIAGGIANVVLDRDLEAPITAGQQLFVNMWSRRMVVSEDAAEDATVITLECADVTSADGNPRLLPGDVFSPHLNYNDVTQIDYSMVCEVLLGGPVVGAYPARKVTVTLKQPLARALKKGEMMSSIQDPANQEEMLWGFSGCDDCSVDDLDVSNARVHAIGSAVIRGPWDGVDPATRKNTRMRYSNIRDSSSDGLGGALTLAWHEDFLVQVPRATLALGSLRSLLVIERSTRGQVLSPSIYGGQYCVTINGECSQISILDLQAAHAMRAFRQANTCSYIALFGGQVLTHSSWSDYAALILANAFDDDDVLSVGASVRNHTVIDGLTCVGPTRTSGTLPGTGSHILVLPQGDTAPEAVQLRDVSSSGASAHGVYMGEGVDCKVSGVIEKSALSGFRGVGGSGNRLDRLDVQEAGLSWAGGAAPKIPAIELVGGTDWGLTGLRTKPGASAGMGQGLAVTGGATIREWSDNLFEGSEVSGGASLVSFASLVDAEVAHQFGWRAADGQVWGAGALMFAGSAGATVIPGLPGSMPGAWTPLHFKCAGDGVADDGAKLNIALEAYKAHVESAPRQLGGPIFDGLGLRYRSTVSIDATGFTAWQWGIRDLTILSEAAGEISLDLVGSRGGRLDQVLVDGSKDAKPRIGIYVARAAAGGQEEFADQSIWIGVKTRGYFTGQAYDSYGQESHITIGCEFWNRQFDANVAVIGGGDDDPGNSTNMPAITGETSNINVHHNRPEFRYLPEVALVTAMTMANPLVCTITPQTGVVFAVGEAVVLGPVIAQTGGTVLESVNAVITAVAGSNVTLDVDASTWAAYSGTGAVLYRAQTKATLRLVAPLRGVQIEEPYIVCYGHRPVEFSWDHSVQAMHGVKLVAPCIEAYGIKSYIHFDTGAGVRELTGCEFEFYQGRAINSYFSIDPTGGSGIKLKHGRLGLLSVLGGAGTFFDTPAKYTLHGIDAVVPYAGLVDPLAVAAWTGSLLTLSTGVKQRLGYPPVIGNCGVTDNSIIPDTYQYDTTLGSSGGPAAVQRGILVHHRRGAGGGEVQFLITESATGSGAWAGVTYSRGRVTGAWGAWVAHGSENGTNANGRYVRHADGTQLAWGLITASAAGEVTWTYPATFLAAANVRVVGTVNSSSVMLLAARITNRTASAVDVSVLNSASARVAAAVEIMAIGDWM
jgi:hypothetical protein